MGNSSSSVDNPLHAMFDKLHDTRLHNILGVSSISIKEVPDNPLVLYYEHTDIGKYLTQVSFASQATDLKALPWTDFFKKETHAKEKQTHFVMKRGHVLHGGAFIKDKDEPRFTRHLVLIIDTMDMGNVSSGKHYRFGDRRIV